MKLRKDQNPSLLAPKTNPQQALSSQ